MSASKSSASFQSLFLRGNDPPVSTPCRRGGRFNPRSRAGNDIQSQGNKVLAALADVPTCGELWGVFGVGAGLTVSGVLLATIWSDVPVARDLDFTPTPGRVTVGRTFGF